MASQSLRPLGLLIHVVLFVLVCLFCLPGGAALIEVIRLRKPFLFPTPIELELVCAAAVILALCLVSSWLVTRVLGWAFVFIGFAAMANALSPGRPALEQMIWLGIGGALGVITGLVAGRRGAKRSAAPTTPRDGSVAAESGAEREVPATFQPSWAAVLIGTLLVVATVGLVIRYELRIGVQSAIAEAAAETGGRTIYDNPGTPPLLFPWLDLLLPHGEERLCLRSVELGPRAGDEDLARLASLGLGSLPHLREIRMRESRITDAALTIVAPLDALERISLGRGITDAGVAQLGVRPSLRMLDLSRTQITGVSLGAMQQFPALVSLSLQNTRITNEDLVHLKGFPELVRLDLSGTSITDEGLVHLTELPNLSAVLLIDTPVTDEGLKHLARIPQLRWLFLNGSRVTPQGRAEFHRACPAVWTD